MTIRRPHIRYLSAPLLILAVEAICACLPGCRMEPPLKLADRIEVVMEMPEVVTDMSVIWDVDPEWYDDWWYGWDATDLSLWGSLEYPVPTDYEVRFYYLGETPGGAFLDYNGLTVMGNTIRRKFDFGYHNLLIWSNINSNDGSQVVAIDEQDNANIRAYTSQSRVSYAAPHKAGEKTYNSPEIFYSVHERGFHVTDNPDDYDYYDEDRGIWVRKFTTTLIPVVYTYLVQCVIYNNNGKITGITESSAMTSLADGMNLNSGMTSDNPASVTFGMRMKKDLSARNGKKSDIIGGKLTTFGLCGMQPWSKTAGSRYEGKFPSLQNEVLFKLGFSNASDSLYAYNVTGQLQQKAHGGVITVEIDADTIKIPSQPQGGGSSGAFDPTVADPESVTTEIEM